VNTFFFEVLGHPLANLFKMEYEAFRKIADPTQFFVTAIILFFISKVEKMNKLKSKKKPFLTLKKSSQLSQFT